MARGVVDDLELIQIQVAQGVLRTVALAAFQSSFQSFVKLAPVAQSGQWIVTRLVSDLANHAARFGHVIEHQHHTQNFSVTVANGGGGILNRVLLTGTADEHRLIDEGDDALLLQTKLHRILRRLTAGFDNRPENRAYWLSPGFLQTPLGELLRHRIQVFDGSFAVGGDHRVTDGVQRDLRAVLLGLKRLLGLLPLLNLSPQLEIRSGKLNRPLLVQDSAAGKGQ